MDQKTELRFIEKIKYQAILLIPGMRILKTALGLFIISLIFSLTPLSRNNITHAAIAVVVGMQVDFKSSLQKSLSRIKGTFIAGVYAYLTISLLIHFNIEKTSIIYIFLISLLCIPLIKLLLFLRSKSSVLIACIVYVLITLGSAYENPAEYAFFRTIDTVIGLSLALFINWLPFLNTLGKKIDNLKDKAERALKIELSSNEFDNI